MTTVIAKGFLNYNIIKMLNTFYKKSEYKLWRITDNVISVYDYFGGKRNLIILIKHLEYYKY